MLTGWSERGCKYQGCKREASISSALVLSQITATPLSALFALFLTHLQRSHRDCLRHLNDFAHRTPLYSQRQSPSCSLLSPPPCSSVSQDAFSGRPQVPPPLFSRSSLLLSTCSLRLLLRLTGQFFRYLPIHHDALSSIFVFTASPEFLVAVRARVAVLGT
jgi:hypothetical protein